MKKLLFATTNLGKLRHAIRVFDNDPIQILTLADFPNVVQVEETGDTFLENSTLKAKGYFEQIRIPCIADDGGLKIDALGGLPGVHSKRWLGYDATDLQLADAVIERMKGVPEGERTARMGSCAVFYNGTTLLHNEHWLEGVIAESYDPAKIVKGLPYRPFFYLPQMGKLYSDLTEEEHQELNFRWKNLRDLRPQILALL